MKTWNKLLIAIAFVLLALVGCSGGDTEGTDNEASNDTSSEEKETIVIGIDDSFPPMGFRDENNEIVGFDIDLARAAGEKMGVEVEFQPIDWAAKESELNSGRIDLIWNGYTITDERKEKVLFTKPYLANSQVVAVLKDSDIQTFADLEGKPVGIQRMSSAVDALNKSELSDIIGELSEYGHNLDALQDLEIKRTEAVIIDEVVINYYMTKKPDTFRILEEALAPEEFGVGVKKGNEELLEKLQAALDEMNEDGTAAEISEKWFGEDKVLK